MNTLRSLALTSVILLLATACGQAKAGTALPKGDDASAYVSSKFEQAMNALRDKLENTRGITSSMKRYFRIDEKIANGELTGARFGSPESRFAHNYSTIYPGKVIDTLTPADGTVEYVYLGADYRSLSPTLWVSMPKPEAGLITSCAWGPLETPCKMANAAIAEYKKSKQAVKSARSRGGGSTEVIVDVTLQTFLDEVVMLIPPKLLARLGSDLKKSMIRTTITLTSDGSPTSFLMDGKFNGDGHEVELHLDFKITGQATARDMPQIPDPAQVTVLDQAGAEDFDRRLGDILNAPG